MSVDAIGRTLSGRYQLERHIGSGGMGAAWQWLPSNTQVNAQGRWSAMMSIVSGLAFLGDGVRLASLEPLGQRMAARHQVIDSISVGPTNADIASGLIFAATGDTARAARHYDNALATARSAPNVLLEPMAQYWYGQLEMRQGRRDTGRDRLRQAAAAFTRLKMPRHLELATRALAEVGGY